MPGCVLAITAGCNSPKNTDEELATANYDVNTVQKEQSDAYAIALVHECLDRNWQKSLRFSWSEFLLLHHQNFASYSNMRDFSLTVVGVLRTCL